MSELPEGWARTSIGSLLRIQYGQGLPARDRDACGSIPVYASSGLVGVHSAALVEGPTVIIGRKGSVGSTYLTTEPSWPIDTVYYARIPSQLSPRYISYQLQAMGLRQLDSSTAIPSLRREDLEAQFIDIAPYREQERIVAAIEEQFSRLDAGVAALERANRRLETLRDQVILKMVNGIGPNRALHEVAEIRLGRQRSPKNHYGTHMRPYLRAANVTWKGLNLSDVKKMNFSPTELSTYALRPGDVVVSEASGSASEVGKPAIWDGSIANCCFQNTLLRLRSALLTPEYLYFVLLALARQGTFSRASKGVGIHHLSKSGLSGLEVEVPSIATQNDITRRIRDQQHYIAALSRAIEALMRRSDRLRSSILAAAFSGNLVPQDATDEPASVLLERITAARASSNGHKSGAARAKQTPLL